MIAALDAASASRFARLALGHVTREFPHRLDHVLTVPGPVPDTRHLRPVFYGSFDWHSCVHGYWLLARLLRRFPAFPEARRIEALFDNSFVPDSIGAECAYFEQPSARAFERPYGWAWLLRLSAELACFPEKPWRAALMPLDRLIADRFATFLPLCKYPIRAGTHANTAFALIHAAGYADTMYDPVFAALLRDTALRWYGGDRDCQAWEPSGEDFLSPALVEAACMFTLAEPADAAAWFDAFLPRLSDRDPTTLFTPAAVADRSDGKLAHLDGCNLSRAWCWRIIAANMPDSDPRHALAEEAARDHLAASLPHIAHHYAGEHWLATFAVLALEPPAPRQTRP